ncbi:MAG: hypothetical protein R3176_03235 [Woeseiaceae bacterium]|nr:hypothetical protein [Woeseiaceae bacterium]
MKVQTVGAGGAAMPTFGFAMLCLAGCAAGDGNGPADRADGPTPAAFRATVTVTVEHPDRSPLSYTVTCAEDAATLAGSADVDAAAACAALARPEVQKRLFAGPPADRMCTEIYGGPDTAYGHGNVNGRRFEFAADRTDGCAISEWDGLLGDILIDPLPMAR